MLDTEPLYQAALATSRRGIGLCPRRRVLSDLDWHPYQRRPKKGRCLLWPCFSLTALYQVGCRPVVPASGRTRHRYQARSAGPYSTNLRRRPSPEPWPLLLAPSRPQRPWKRAVWRIALPTSSTSDQVARGKPAPDLYLEAASRLGLPPASCIALEDSEAGVQSASTAGDDRDHGARPQETFSPSRVPSVQNPVFAAPSRSFDCRLASALIRPILFEPTDCKVHDVSLRHELAICKTNPAAANDMARVRSQKVLADAIKI